MHSTPTIKVVTAHGNLEIEPLPKEIVRDALRRYRVPMSCVYICNILDGKEHVLTGKEICEELSGDVLAYANRNIRLLDIATSQTRVMSVTTPATSYVSPNQSSANPFDCTLVELSDTDVCAMASEALNSVLQAHAPDLWDRRVIVGFSGGGDPICC